MDPIANFLTTIRNAYRINSEETATPASKVTRALADALKKEGYLLDVKVDQPVPHRSTLLLRLKYQNKTAVVERIRRISRPGRRVYVTTDRIPRPIGGVGTIFLSTPKGILTGKEAQKQRLGGEVLCEVIRGGLA